MAKAVLVTDMPDNCVDCVLFCDEDCYCQYNWHDTGHDDYHPGRADWCPLIPEPERMTEWAKEQEEAKGRDYVIGMTDGWNACLDALEGKT